MPLLRVETKSFVEEGSAGKEILDSDSLKRCGSVPVSVSKLEAEYVVERSSMEAVACTVELLSVELLVEKREDMTSERNNEAASAKQQKKILDQKRSQAVGILVQSLRVTIADVENAVIHTDP